MSRRRNRAAGWLTAAAIGTGVVFGTVGVGLVGAQPAVAACESEVTTLVLYDTTGEYGFLGERYATMTANLASHFGTWRAEPVVEYRAGELSCAQGAVYLGSTYGEPLPDAFLDDVAAGGTPVMWVRDNLGQLAGRLPVTEGSAADTRPYDTVEYRGRRLGRDQVIDAGLTADSLGPDAEVLATASGPGVAARPWATRRGNLLHIAENPLLYVAGNDRYLAFTDLFYELLAPETTERHRALVRLEDVSPMMDPSQLRVAVDALIDEAVPFAIAVIPEYHDGRGSRRVVLADRPELVEVLRYAVAHGATLVLHGVTHQVDGIENPYSGETAADYEFFRAVVDDEDYVRLVGPLAGTSYESWRERLEHGIALFLDAGLPRPQVVTPPHYAASADAYRAMRDLFPARFDRGLYFDDELTTGTADETAFYDQFFTYPVTDVHGMTVIPENLGNESPELLNNNPARGVDDLVRNAEAALVVRDGFGAFFWHPYLVARDDVGVEHLHQIVERIRGLGYEFVGLDDLVPGAAAYVGELDPGFTMPDIRPYHVLAVFLAVWLPLRRLRRHTV